MIGTNGERGSGKSVLAARYDDDVIYTYIVELTNCLKVLNYWPVKHYKI